jgi:hypothetical protein
MEHCGAKMASPSGKLCENKNNALFKLRIYFQSFLLACNFE